MPTKEKSKVSRLDADQESWRVARCARKIQELIGPIPPLAIVLGSGFQELGRMVRALVELDYGELPGFPRPAVAGHAGRLIYGELGGAGVILCCGRSHFYEGIEIREVVFPARVLAECGVKDLVLTNAAGGINSRYSPGDFMLFSDHINFTGVNPLRGMPTAEGRCFVDLTEVYSKRLSGMFRKAASKTKSVLREGVYIGVSGPSYETPAEIRAFRKWGADAVGMSTIPEVLMGRYCGMEIAAVSCITNSAAGMGKGKLSHLDVLRVGEKSARQAGELFAAFGKEYARKSGN